MFTDQIILRDAAEKCFMVLCPEYPKIVQNKNTFCTSPHLIFQPTTHY